MSKVKSIGIQFANGIVRMYLNEPAVELVIGKPDDTCPYRVKINGDTMECREIAKLIVDNWAVSYPDPYIKIPSVRNKDELQIWRSKLGLSAFSDIWRVVSDSLLLVFCSDCVWLVESSEVVDRILEVHYSSASSMIWSLMSSSRSWTRTRQPSASMSILYLPFGRRLRVSAVNLRLKFLAAG